MTYVTLLNSIVYLSIVITLDHKTLNNDHYEANYN